VGADAGAVVLLSGGLDSATCLAIAREKGFRCYALSFDYGQRHTVELSAAAAVAGQLGAVEHKVVGLNLQAIGGSALTDPSIEVPVESTSGIPVTYVPARNTVFLSIALGWAEVLGVSDIYIGVNAVDYSGYPDCRPAFVDAFQKLANLATRVAVEGQPITIHAPLIELGKGAIIRRGLTLGVDYGLTVSCYRATTAVRRCGECDACRLRDAGFAEAGAVDPLAGVWSDHPGQTAN
jgi:7-cyano-7-deazaguanine synthase